MSTTVFAVFGIAVPVVSHFLLACEGCDARHDRPYDGLVQLSMSGVATLSYLYLSTFVRRYGLRRFLFFDKLWDESETVSRSYTQQLNRSLKILVIFIFPSILAESAYKIWWCVLAETDGEDGGEEDDLNNTKLIPAYAYNTISFQKRQALVTYFENNRYVATRDFAQQDSQF